MKERVDGSSIGAALCFQKYDEKTTPVTLDDVEGI